MVWYSIFEHKQNFHSQLVIFVLGHPIIFPLTVSVEKGKSATFTCNATGVPGQNITWKKTEQIIGDNKYRIISSGSGTSQLTVKDISISDYGYYVCDTSAIVNQRSSARGFLGVTCKLCAYVIGVSCY